MTIIQLWGNIKKMKYIYKKYRYKLIKKIKTIIIILKCKYLNFFVIKKSKNNLFIDLGSNLGQGFTFFSKYFNLSNFDYLLVEANPNLFSHLNKIVKKIDSNKISLINKAAFTYDGKIKLFGLVEDERGNISTGASVIKEHNSNVYEANANNALSIECFNFVNKIKEFKNYDNIVIKMDIEGSEYDVLNDIIKNIHEIKNITHIFIEFHSKFVSDNYKKNFLRKEYEIKNKLKNHNISFLSYI